MLLLTAWKVSFPSIILFTTGLIQFSSKNFVYSLGEIDGEEFIDSGHSESENVVEEDIRFDENQKIEYSQSNPVDNEKYQIQYPESYLSNGRAIPLIGLGMGNLGSDDISSALDFSFGRGLGWDLIDTSHASKNEELIVSSMKSVKEGIGKIKIVTKVWYTHLGYERTRLSVLESLGSIGKDAEVHILLHWPRCDESISQMNCLEEETLLPDYVKEAGPSPLDDRNAFLQSWKALEELYVNEEQIFSIGVSNFAVDDWYLLLDGCNIVPHIHQGHILSFYNNAELRHILNEYRVLFQAYNVMSHFGREIEVLPIISQRLQEIAEDMSVPDKSTLVMAWLSQNRIGIVARSKDEFHLKANSPMAVGSVEYYNEDENNLMGILVNGIINKEDILTEEDSNPKVRLNFVNNLDDAVTVHWINPDGGSVQVERPEAHSEVRVVSHPGHEFVVKDKHGEDFALFVVSANYGEEETHYIEL